jgi:hypothetical protein
MAQWNKETKVAGELLRVEIHSKSALVEVAVRDETVLAHAQETVEWPMLIQEFARSSWHYSWLDDAAVERTWLAGLTVLP